MSKVSVYKQEGFMLTKEGEYYVTLDVELKITKTGIEKGEEKFSLEIAECKVNKDERFSREILPHLSPEAMSALYNHLTELLRIDVADQLYTYYYRGTIQPAS